MMNMERASIETSRSGDGREIFKKFLGRVDSLLDIFENSIHAALMPASKATIFIMPFSLPAMIQMPMGKA